MRVAEIFYSIQGEGVYQGVPMVFVRLAGCPLLPHCDFCDTSYAWEPQDGKEMEVWGVAEEIGRLSPRYKGWLCITGGEPLWQIEELEKLVRLLKGRGYLVTTETNGAFEVPPWYTLVDSWSADMKCPSSGVCGVSKEEWLRTRCCDQVKFVVGNTEDLEFTRKVIGRLETGGPTVLVSPMSGVLVDKKRGMVEEYWNKEWLREVAEFCIEEGVRYSLQIHKVIWGGRRGV